MDWLGSYPCVEGGHHIGHKSARSVYELEPPQVDFSTGGSKNDAIANRFSTTANRFSNCVEVELALFEPELDFRTQKHSLLVQQHRWALPAVQARGAGAQHLLRGGQPADLAGGFWIFQVAPSELRKTVCKPPIQQQSDVLENMHTQPGIN